MEEINTFLLLRFHSEKQARSKKQEAAVATMTGVSEEHGIVGDLVAVIQSMERAPCDLVESLLDMAPSAEALLASKPQPMGVPSPIFFLDLLKTTTTSLSVLIMCSLPENYIL